MVTTTRVGGCEANHKMARVNGHANPGYRMTESMVGEAGDTVGEIMAMINGDVNMGVIWRVTRDCKAQDMAKWGMDIPGALRLGIGFHQWYRGHHRHNTSGETHVVGLFTMKGGAEVA